MTRRRSGRRASVPINPTTSSRWSKTQDGERDVKQLSSSLGTKRMRDNVSDPIDSESPSRLKQHISEMIVQSDDIEDLGRAKYVNDPPLIDYLEEGEEFPSLPVVTDPKFLDYVWKNLLETTKPHHRLAKKHSPFIDLELIGDAYLLWQARMQLRKICGEENWHLIKLLEEHAKGNALLIQIGKHYMLDQWVQTHPSPKRPKDWADIVEAWIGAVIKERLLWNEDDRLEELSLFIEQIWRLRYRGLKDYFVGIHSRNDKTGNYDIEVIEERIVEVPGDKLIANIVDTSSQTRNIGYQVTVRIRPQSPLDDTISLKHFATTLEKARDVAVQCAINCKEDKSHSPPWRMDISQSKTLFQEYRTRCFEEIRRSHLHDEPPSRTIIRELGIKYASWIQELKDLTASDDDYRRTIIMLKWYQSFLEVEKCNYRESYELIGSVLEYAVQMFPRTRLLLREAIMRLYQIVDAKNNPLKIKISEDLRDGTITGNGYPQYQWNINNFQRHDSGLSN